MAPTRSQLRIPDALANWPYKRQINPHFVEVKAESDEWVQNLHAFNEKSQWAFDRCDFALLAALVYPMLDKAGLRTAANLLVLLFVFDDYTDRVDGAGVQAYADIVLDALHNPHKPRPEGESVIGEIARQFWATAITHSSQNSQRHLIQTFTEYVNAVVKEADDRVQDHVRHIDEYMELRRQTAGGYPCFFPVERHFELPDDVIFHPTIQRLCLLACNSIVLTNDVCSYNIEQSAGHEGHNILTVVMRQKGLDMEASLDWVTQYHSDCLAEFLELRRNLPSFGPELDDTVAEYVDGVAQWVRGGDCWSFESRRYFGDRGLEVQKVRKVDLLPVLGMDDMTPMMAPMVIEAQNELNALSMTVKVA
ncbi:terpenoid synthase [Artomyces pyxidatus]|uniref:Terpenoid synthase n=1 Tax=Artomyces pyxidatus TaxID=48021 RepID=A0ACB8SS25_9AGAM|nr:terpenoid synthase [Artomyces pyxidatus]